MLYQDQHITGDAVYVHIAPHYQLLAEHLWQPPMQPGVVRQLASRRYRPFETNPEHNTTCTLCTHIGVTGMHSRTIIPIFSLSCIV